MQTQVMIRAFFASLVGVVGVACAPAPSSVSATTDTQPADVSDAFNQPADPWTTNFGVEESQGDGGCDNLDLSHCLYPFPSDRFREVTDAGGSLVFGTSLPRPLGEEALSDEHFRGFDGFSTVTPIRFFLPAVDLVRSQAPSLQNIDRSLESDSPTVVIDAETGESQPHWAEIDHFSQTGSQPRLVTLRFPVPLASGRRYIVAVRGLVDADGAIAAPSAGFAALRDQTVSDWRGVHARRGHFESLVFPALESQGVMRAELQLAWDFTTQSAEDATSLARSMAERLYEAMGDDGPAYTITNVEELVDEPHIARIVTLQVEVPSFVEAPVENVRRIRRDPNTGEPVISGTESVIATLQIPHAVVDAPGDAPVLQYGHGLLGRATEANKDWLRGPAERHGFVIVAADMQGMDEDNIATWASVLGAPERFPHLSEEPLQGIMNHLAIMRLFKGALSKDPNPALTSRGRSVYAPSRLYYYGNSQGGTLGTVIMGLSEDLQRGVLGVPGCAFEFLLHRSTGFTAYADLLSLSYSPTDFTALVSLISLGFSRIEGVAFAPLIEQTSVNGAPRRVLLHIAKEDSVVDNKVSFLLGRALDAKLLKPVVRSVWGVAESDGPIDAGHAVVEVDFGHPDNPDPMQPAPQEHDTHEDLRRNLTAQDQWWQFLATGQVIHSCEGVCDPD